MNTLIAKNLNILIDFLAKREYSMRKSSFRRLNLYQMDFIELLITVVAQSEYPLLVTTLPKC